MADIVKDKYVVLKNEDIEKYCKAGDLNALDFIKHKIKKGRQNEGKSANNSYYVCNTDEPYADKVLQEILKGEDDKAKPFQYPVVTLCGSTKFKEEFLRAQRELTLNGCIVITVGLFGHSGDCITEEEKAMLDDMHKRKIDMADGIYVINVGGYIGSSTKSEIEYAEKNGKYITYLEPLN